MQTGSKPSSILARPVLTAALLASSVLSTSTFAREHLYGALDYEPLQACDTLFWSGQSQEAGRCYILLNTPGQDARLRAEALWAQGDMQGANTQFQQAFNDYPDDPMVRVRWGELFMETFQYQEAYNLFSEALALDENNAWAHIGAAASLAEGGDPEVLNQH